MLLSIRHVFQEMEELERRGLSIGGKVLKLDWCVSNIKHDNNIVLT